MHAIRVYIIGPSLMAEGLRLILKDSFAVIGVGLSTRDLDFPADGRSPDVLLIDCNVQDPDWLDCILQVRSSFPEIAVVLVSRRIDKIALRRATQLGVAGFVLVEQNPDELCDAIRMVMRGSCYFAPALQQHISFAGGVRSSLRRGRSSGLTNRQEEVLRCVADGRTNKQTAALLKISTKTVEFHRATIMRTLGLRSVAELSHFAMRNGLVGVLA